MFGGKGLNAGSVEVSLNTKFDSSGLDKFDRAINSSRADLKKFDSSVDKSEKNTKNFSRAGSGLSSSLKRAAGAAAGAAAAYMGIAQAKQAISATTDLAKTTGMLNKNLGLSVKTSSQFAAVAKTRGIEVTSLGMAFRTLSKQIEEAKSGSEKSVSAFNKLGISTNDLKNQNVEQTFYDIADGLGQMEAGTEKFALGGQLLSRGWQKLSPLIRDGSGALKEQLQLAEQYGASFSGKSIKSINDLIAAERELQLMQLGLQIQFTQLIAPSLTKFAQFVGKLGKEFKNGTGTGGMLRDVFQSIGEILKAMWPTIKAAAIVFVEITRVFSSLPAPVQTALASLGLFMGVAAKLGVLVPILTKVWSAAKLLFGMFKVAPMLMGPLGLALAGLVVAAVLIVKNWGWVKKALGNTWNWIKKAFNDVKNFVIDAAKKGFLGPTIWIIANWGKVKRIFQDLPGKIRGFLSGLGQSILRPFQWAKDKVVGVFQDMVNKAKSAIDTIKGLPGQIGGKVGGFFGKIIPGKRDGGRVGPTAGGPRMFVAGEGGKDEWVISQEGNRRSNIGYLMEAAQALGVSMFASGGKIGKKQEKRLNKLGGQLTNLESKYAYDDRRFGMDGTYSQREIQNLVGIKSAMIRNLRAQQKIQRTSERYWRIKELQLDKKELWKRLKDQTQEASGPSFSEQLAAFNTERFAMLGSFGGNVRARSASAPSQAMSSAGAGKTINITQNYQKPPEDPHAWTRKVQHEVNALV